MRKTTLKQASTGVVITTVVIVALLGILRARVLQPGEAAAREGSAVFVDKGCAQCHYTDSTATKIGPGLKGLFEREDLPVSGRAVSEENVREQLETPYENMPSFADRLTKEERDRLIAYLKTL
jgi:mono/diheme cytochrome c family protein